jgi:hypothetical protein
MRAGRAPSSLGRSHTGPSAAPPAHQAGFPVFPSFWQATKITAALREYQRLWHQSWLAACSSVRPSFGAFVLVRHAETSELFANFDQQMIQLVVEGRWCAALPPACRPTGLRSMEHGGLAVRLPRPPASVRGAGSICRPARGRLARRTDSRFAGSPGMGIKSAGLFTP